MKIVFENPLIYLYATGHPAVTGGAERQQWLLAKALAQRGHEAVVYTRSHVSREAEVIDGVVYRWISPFSPLQAWPKILAREKADWWYFRLADFYLGYLAPLAKAHGTRVAFACGIDSDCLPLKALRRRKYLWPFYLLGLVIADRILVQHEIQRRLLPRVLQAKIHLVPSIAGGNQPAASRGEYVAWVGVMRRHKRPHLIVEVARQLPQVRFVVCGPPHLVPENQAYTRMLLEQFEATPNISYQGQVSPAEAQRVIAGASLLLSTSDLEGLPNTFLHAWGAGVPVVAVGPDPGQAIAASGGGAVAANLAEGIKAIGALLQDRERNQRLGQKGYAYIQAIHGEEAAVTRLLAALANDRR